MRFHQQEKKKLFSRWFKYESLISCWHSMWSNKVQQFCFLAACEPKHPPKTVKHHLRRLEGMHHSESTTTGYQICNLETRKWATLGARHLILKAWMFSSYTGPMLASHLPLYSYVWMQKRCRCPTEWNWDDQLYFSLPPVLSVPHVSPNIPWQVYVVDHV